jgi:hypothetical protein
MKSVLIGIASLTLASCGTALRQRAAISPALPPVSAYKPAPEARTDREDSAREAIEFYLLKRTGGAPLPAERVLAARRHARGMPLYSIAQRRLLPAGGRMTAHDMVLGSWQPLGPGNIGGRTRSLVIRPDDPNTMYAGAVGGGVWKTTDGGRSWSPLSDLLPSIGISALAMDPASPDTLYAGTGEWYAGDAIRGAGIFQTTDGGATWTLLEGTANHFFYYVNKIVLSPGDSRRIYAATWDGVFFSPDAGATWQMVLDRSGALAGCQDLVIRTDQASDYLFAACGAEGAADPAIFRNVDAAGSGKWEKAFTADNMARTSLALAPSNQATVYAAMSSGASGDWENGLLGVYRSTTSGDPDSWEMRVSNQDSNRLNTALFSNPTELFADICSRGKKTFVNQGDYDNVIAVDPLNPDVVWVGGIDVFRSDDGGRNWGIAAFWETDAPQLVHADVHAVVFAPGYNGSDNQTLYTATDGGVYRTGNALAATAQGDRAACAPYSTGVAWTNLNNGYEVTQFYHGTVYPGGAAYFGGTQDNGTVRGSDAGSRTDWLEIMGGDGGVTALDPDDPNVVYAEEPHLGFRRSTNGGQTFSSAVRGIGELSDNFAFVAPFRIDPANSKRLYLGGGTLWRSTDGAQNWVAASSALPSSAGRISAVAISPADPGHVVFGTSKGLIFYSSGALSATKDTVWDSVQPRTGYLSHLEFDPADPHLVYATYSQYNQKAGQSHVYRSTDGGATWTGIDGSGETGLPDVPFWNVIIDPLSPSTLYLGSDIGVFVTLDGGATWARDSNPFADAVTETLALDRTSGQNALYAFTHGRGVWKTVLPGSGDACQYELSAGSATIPAGAGTEASFTVTTGGQCSWSVVQRDGGLYFTLGSPAAGSGTGSFAVKPRYVNNTTGSLSSTLLVQNKAVSVTQEAATVAGGNDDGSSPFAVGKFPAVLVENTEGATEAPSDPVHSCTNSADGKTIWFALQAPDAGTLAVFFSNWTDRGTDAGTVMTAYRLVNGVLGPESGCLVVPQSRSATGFKGLQWKFAAAGTLMIEISATTSGASSTATAAGGNLSLYATFTK